MKRYRDLIGRWGYCSKCGNKVFETGTRFTEPMCGARCGYISKSFITFKFKNTRRFE